MGRSEDEEERKEERARFVMNPICGWGRYQRVVHTSSLCRGYLFLRKMNDEVVKVQF